MRKPVLIISDTHYHNFTQYASIASSGVNTRLGDILRATAEAAKTLHDLGGDTIIHCGDVFHVRGSLPPSVLNPVVDLYDRLIKSGFKVHMISGNHDLETDFSHKVSSSVSALAAVGVQVYHEPTRVLIDDRWWGLVPWIKNMDDLRGSLPKGVERLVIHAPLNGVIASIPDHGLNPKDFEGLPVDNVFCGHYHNHRVFDITHARVVSVGALTHQNWGDTASKAGFLILHPDNKLEHFTTDAPKFRKIAVKDLMTPKDDFFADNYIKVVDGAFTDPVDIQKIKDDLLLRGAKAVIVEGLVKRPVATRGGTSSGTPTIETILGDYMDRTYPGEADVKNKALEIIRLVSDDYS